MEANTKSDWIWALYFKIAMGGYFISITLQSIATTLIYWIQNKPFDTEHLYHAYRTM